MFRFKLAHQLGKTVAELCSGVPGPLLAAEETYQVAYYKRDPFGYERADIGFAQICQLIWNTNVKKGGEKKMTDFMPFYRKPVAKKDSNISDSIRAAFAKIVPSKKKD